MGKTGIVTNVYSDGDLRIQILDDPSKKMWTFNPQCVSLVQRCAIQDSQAPNSSPGNGSTEPQPALSQPADALEMRQLMTKVAQGNLEYVKELYEKDKSIVSYKKK